MRRPSTKQRRFVILLLALLTFGIAYYGGHRYSTPELPPISGVLLQPAMPVPQFTLTDQYGEVFSAARLEEHWGLITLDPQAGSTDSPAFRRLVQVHNRFAAEPELQRQLQFIYIPRWSDSELDAAAVELNSGFFVLHGESSEITELFGRFGVEHNRDDFTLFLANPRLQLQALFTSGQNATTIASDFNTLISHYR